MTEDFIIICRNCDSTNVTIEPIYDSKINGIEIVTNVKLNCKSCGFEENLSVTSQEQE